MSVQRLLISHAAMTSHGKIAIKKTADLSVQLEKEVPTIDEVKHQVQLTTGLQHNTASIITYSVQQVIASSNSNSCSARSTWKEHLSVTM